MSAKSAITLTDYQQNWVNDKSRFKIGVFTRQGGKSFGTSLEAVLDCLEHPRTEWVFLSAGERQSRKLINTAILHARASMVVVDAIEGEFKGSDDVKYKSLEITFPNGSRIIGLPANPETARGWSANILLDEFAMHKDSRAIWSAMFPTVTRGYKIRIISTFKGKSNKFYELIYSSKTLQRFNGPDFEHVGERGGWSKHFVSIHQAVEMGLELKDDEGRPIEPEDLRLALNDDDAWEEEFCCIASDEASAFLSHDLISSVEDVKINPGPSWADVLIQMAGDMYKKYRTHGGPEPDLFIANIRPLADIKEFYLGLDVGRKKDLSIIWILQQENGLKTVAPIVLKNQPFFVQKRVLHTLMAHKGFRRACIDETGIGAQLAEEAGDQKPGMVEGIAFSPGSKEALAVGLKQAVEDKAVAIPADSTIRASLHSVKKYATTTKHFRFDADRTDKTGHADHFWALALAVHAATNAAGPAACGGADPESRRRITETDRGDGKKSGIITPPRGRLRDMIRRGMGGFSRFGR